MSYGWLSSGHLVAPSLLGQGGATTKGDEQT